MAGVKLNLLVEDPAWKGLRPTVQRAASAALTAEGVTEGSLALVLTNDAQVQELNRDYRGKDAPTNVLSFEDGCEDETGRVQLGDVILAYETIAREAVEQGKTLKAHLTHLVVHGVLHVLGYDHIAEDEAEAMEAREVVILAAMGIADPYR